jgi:UDP-glucose 4-epimerase
MKVVITGGSGFIGTNLMEHFGKVEPDTEVILLDIVPPMVTMPANARFMFGDIRNLASLIQAFEGADEVYNLAGILGTSELIRIAALATEINVAGAANVMEACRICGVDRVYNVAKPHFEGYAENAYTLTKHAGELLGIMYRDKYDMNVATVRWLNAVGPHQHLYPVRKFVPMMVLLALNSLPLQVYGSGNQTIDPIDTDDLSRFTLHACRNLGRHPEVVDLGSGVAISCNDTTDMILKVFDDLKIQTSSVIAHIPMREGEGDDINLCADTTYWDSVGMKTEVSFEDSIRKVIGYIRNLPEYHKQNALEFYGIDNS